ncbi:MAG: LPS-assembly protein LptD [Saprospiraceae bacterium]|nr:LPS-assembly protein LptD [Saprospiraceae bacterium]MCB9320566.1 LPS-assembly protein LptD [Lewinellaceae bacterium]
MNKWYWIGFMVAWMYVLPLAGQRPVRNLKPTLPSDTLQVDSLTHDSTKISFARSKDALDDEVIYKSADSTEIDNQNKLAYLFGDAEVKFQDMTLTAGLIIFDMTTNIARAMGQVDSAGAIIGKPHFEQGGEQFDADSIRFNFKTKKGIIYAVSTVYNDMYLKGYRTKIIDATGTIPGDTSDYKIIYNENAIITSCDAPEPHFGIRSQKQKLVPNKQVIVGPSTLEIEGVPVFWLPFGFFPIKETQKAGLIFPRDYEFSPQWGFGLRNVGYYTPLGEHFDLKLTGDIYTRGSWGLSAATNYVKRYKYSGNANVAFSNRESEQNDGTYASTKSFAVTWSHTQDSRANPYQRLSGNVNIQTGSYQQLNYNDAQSKLQNSLSSNVSYFKSFPGKPFTMSVNAGHSQNSNTKQISVTLPTLNFQMNRIYPFKRQKVGGKEHFYERISFKYDANMQNRVDASDSTLFESSTWQNARRGIRHSVSSDLNFKLLKYFTFNTGFNYKENWNFSYYDYNYDALNNTVTTDTINQFRAVRLYDYNMTMNTILYGTIGTRWKGKIRGIRHVMKPSISFNASPDYIKPELDYFEYINGTYYNRFKDAVYDRPSSTGPSAGMAISVANSFEAKVWSERDSTIRKVKLLEQLNVSTFYNFIADSLKWSPIMASSGARIGKISSLTFGARFDPYKKIGNQRVNQYADRFLGVIPLRIEDMRFSFTTSIRGKQIKDFFSKEKDTKQSNNSTTSAEDDFFELFNDFAIRHNFTYAIGPDNNQNIVGKVVANSLYMTGSLQIAPLWSIRIGNIGYDFNNKRITYPDFGFNRDLHCWMMSFNWQPQYGTYSFVIRVKDDKLGFIKIPYNKNNYDVFGR